MNKVDCVLLIDGHRLIIATQIHNTHISKWMDGCVCTIEVALDCESVEFVALVVVELSFF